MFIYPISQFYIFSVPNYYGKFSNIVAFCFAFSFRTLGVLKDFYIFEHHFTYFCFYSFTIFAYFHMLLLYYNFVDFGDSYTSID